MQIAFVSNNFDPSKETANEINPIAGEGLLQWLSERLRATGFMVGAPEAEDWGWFTSVSHNGRTYMLGASGEPEAGTADIEWSVQLVKHRSVTDKLFGRNTLSPDDPVALAIERIIRADSAFHAVSVSPA